MPIPKKSPCTPPRQASGGARLIASGKRPVTFGLTEDEHKKIFAAAAAVGRPATQFFIHYGLRAAEKILKKEPTGLD